MNDQDRIRKAIALADGFDHSGVTSWRIQEPDHYPVHAQKKHPPRWFLGALAAQLAQQVDDMERVELDVKGNGDVVVWDFRKNSYRIAAALSSYEDRSIATIRVILESEVLE